MEWKHNTLPYRINDCREELQPDVIYALLQTSYWAAHRSKETVLRSFENSLCFGLYYGEAQVGFMRVVTDYATFAWVCDVIVHPDHRGQGLGKSLMQFLVEHPAVQGTRMVLGTRDAHGLYEQYGFERQELMRRPIPGAAQ
ncbi:GNAT family N-acetyltransferase [Paenibacillus oleatilyticus]|uniref:GNAT family N-acetyltransferase n=1 Tax=Paenibacillus oleatilyticus TaxID=2594886 RepID=UPI001C200228|nr:GNAT family N-acetyltransferase [Paenibacillus oleatilyticus]MBU7315745.1 GNAT family N-acetyltransferase [Paenibacillus oleatilyticus]